MKKSSGFLFISISIFVLFLAFHSQMPFEAYIFTAILFFLSFLLYSISLFIESKEETPDF
jgi:hypothetical protein